MASGMDLINSRKQGMAGFSARTNITDDLITQALERDRGLKADLAAKENAVTLATTKTKASADLRQAQMGNQTTLKAEEMQQAGLTARQKITEAGNLAVEALQGKNNLAQQQSADAAALGRVTVSGEEDRKSKKAAFEEELNQLFEYKKKIAAEGLGNSGAVQQSGSSVAQPGYTYTPGKGISTTGVSGLEIEDYLGE